MSRAVVLLIAVILLVIAPAVILSFQLSRGVQHETRAQDASVRVLAGPVGIATGRIARLRVRVVGPVVEGVRLREVRASLQGVTIDPGRALRGELIVRDLEGGSASMTIGEADLQSYLRQAKDVRGARVRLNDGVAIISGTVRVLNSDLEVDMRARLALSDDRHIVLQVEHLDIGGVQLPPEIGNALATAVNPLITAPRRPFPIRFTGVAVDDGRAVITGEPTR